MLEQIVDYGKCAYRNSFTRTGYLMLGMGGGLEVLRRSVDLPENVSFCNGIAETLMFANAALTLYLSRFGAATYSAYTQCKRIFEKKGRVPNDVTIAYYTGDYCPGVGIEMAAKENNLFPIPPPTIPVETMVENLIDNPNLSQLLEEQGFRPGGDIFAVVEIFYDPSDDQQD